ncbi:type IV pilin protein [Luteimonas sp. R10]|uniref:type IV pilin protein n=1 Tax=Luteimonas sp. R10 TaxID=3108176 RepID=UPI00308637FB|nr:type IV pilin protein [Luteimonas sp. R10]
MKRFSRSRTQAGFTLIEVMITVLIIAVLAAIAYTSYQSHVTKTRRAAAATCLQERAQFMERYYSTYLTYNNADSPPVIGQCDVDVAAHYAVGLVAGSLGAKEFTLEAVPQDGQATRDADCGTLTLDEKGGRGVSGSKPADECW